MKCQTKEEAVASKILDAVYSTDNDDDLHKKIVEILKESKCVS